MPSIITCKDLCKAFGQTRALNMFNLDITERSTVGIVGTNGAGKSTFFSILCGFLPRDAGDVLIYGYPPGHKSLLGRISILPQDAPFLKGISVWEQLRLFARLQGFDNPAAEHEIYRVLESVKLTEVAKQLPETLSHGQRKRIAIAQALIGKPELILLDEPTAGLDPVAAIEIRNIIYNLTDKTTLMISSHNLAEVQDHCEQIVLIDHGTVIDHTYVANMISEKTSFTLKLDQEISDDLINLLKSEPEIMDIEVNKNNSRLITIQVRENIGKAQMSTLEILQAQSINIIQMQRGGSLTDKIRQIAGRQ